MTKRIVQKAAALAALYEADQAGALEGLTQQDITSALGLAHRSAGGRYLKELEELRVMIPELLQAFQDAQERRIPKFHDLQELTGHESGAVQYSDGSIWIGNWSGIAGIPRQFATGMIGLGETLTAARCPVPADVRRAMRKHEKEQGGTRSRRGFMAWLVNGETVVVMQKDWA
jgi:hypothetical protein